MGSDLGDIEQERQHFTLRYIGKKDFDATLTYYRIADDTDGRYVTPVDSRGKSLAGNDIYSTLTRDPIQNCHCKCD